MRLDPLSLNVAILKALGIDPSNCRAVTIRIVPGQYPTVRITRVQSDFDKGALTTSFTLRPKVERGHE